MSFCLSVTAATIVATVSKKQTKQQNKQKKTQKNEKRKKEKHFANLRSLALRTLQNSHMCSCLQDCDRFRCFGRECFGNDSLLQRENE